MSQGEDNKTNSLPLHVGVIMDGNGRWATLRGLPRNAGHNKGADVFEKIANYALKLGVKHLTVYAFSTENFERPPDEVETIMNLMRRYIKDQRRRQNKDVRMIFLGDIMGLPEDIRQGVRELEENTKSNNKMILNVAFNYGGRQDILQASKALATLYRNGGVNLDSFAEEDFTRLLYTADQPEVDLIIRTSGEERISNFLIWQSAYAEFIFSKVLWPDYTTKDFDKDLEEYARRNRRMGGI